MSSLPPLLACPADIFPLFLQQLSSPDLYSLCLVCKTLRTLAEPNLYSHIRLIWLDPEDASTPQISPIIPLLRSILSRPELAAHVQYLDLGGQPIVRWTGRRSAIPVADADLAELITFIEGFQDNIDYASLWITELCNGSIDPFVALLLSVLSNLKQLHITTHFAEETRIIGKVLRSALCDTATGDRWLPTFGDIQEVSFRMDMNLSRPMEMRNTEDLLPLFYLPSVRKMSVCIENPTVFVWPLNQRPTASLLASLELKGTSIREDHLGELLSATPNLRRLHWDWFYHPERPEKFGGRVIDLHKVAAAIGHVRDTLEEFAIFASVSYHGLDFPILSTRGSLSPIAEYEALRTFEAPVPFLIGFTKAGAWPLERSLPKNLGVLTISDDLYLVEEYEWSDTGAIMLLEAIISWLRNYTAYTPQFQTLRLELRVIDEEWGPKMRRQLADVCAVAGLGLVINKIEKDLYSLSNPASY